MDPLEIPARLIRVKNVEKAQKKIGNTRSNHVISLENINSSEIVINMNQRLRRLFIQDCKDTLIQMLDSAVILTRKVDIINCHNLTISLDEVDLRYYSFFNCSGIKIQTGDSETLIENFRFYWHGCTGDNTVERTIIKPGTNPNEHFICPVVSVASYRVQLIDGAVTESRLAMGKDLVSIPCLTEAEVARSVETVLQEIQALEDGNAALEAKPMAEWGQLYERELAEVEDEAAVMQSKAKVVAEAIKNGRHVVIYTGAGISTAAQLPDYRGPHGVWTQRARGELPGASKMDLGMARPTYAHYAINHLVKKGLITFVTSTNLDGLHRRSGVPNTAISELHGNCYREFCELCDLEHFRSYDTLPTRTDRWTHHTGRFCDACGGHLRDSIIHFTENIRPDEWSSAVSNARASDVAIVMGTSMNVQPAASLPDKCLENGGKLFIVNLQRTPYDQFATEKIYAKTDDFMYELMNELGLLEFETTFDLCTVMRKKEDAAARLKTIKKSVAIAGAVAAASVLAFVAWKRFVKK